MIRAILGDIIALLALCLTIWGALAGISIFIDTAAIIHQ